MPNPCNPSVGPHTMTWDGPPPDGPHSFNVALGVKNIFLWGFDGQDYFVPLDDNAQPFTQIGNPPRQTVQFFGDGTGVQMPSGKTFHWT